MMLALVAGMLMPCIALPNSIIECTAIYKLVVPLGKLSFGNASSLNTGLQSQSINSKSDKNYHCNLISASVAGMSKHASLFPLGCTTTYKLLILSLGVAVLSI